MSSAESLLGAGKRLQIEGWWGVQGVGGGGVEVKGKKEEEEEGCTLGAHVASPTWLLFLAKRRER